MKLPDAIYIGYFRCASTFIGKYLERHPSITGTRQAWALQLHYNDSKDRVREYQSALSYEGQGCCVDRWEGLCLGYCSNLTSVDVSLSGSTDLALQSKLIKNYSSFVGSGVVVSTAEMAERVRSVSGKVIIGIRSQLSWFDSVTKHYRSYFKDTGLNIQSLLNTMEGKVLAKVAHYDDVVSTYERVLGRENVFVFLLEELSTEHKRPFMDLCKFLDVPFSDGWHHSDKNAISDKTTFEITREQRELVKSMYSVSNYNLASWLGRELPKTYYI